MNLREATRMALDAGWCRDYDVHGGGVHNDPTTPCGYKDLLDPFFWQALGKAMGWEKRKEWFAVCSKKCGHEISVYGDDLETYKKGHCWECGALLNVEERELDSQEFRTKQYRLLDHLWDGGSIESFFQSL